MRLLVKISLGGPFCLHVLLIDVERTHTRVPFVISDHVYSELLGLLRKSGDVVVGQDQRVELVVNELVDVDRQEVLRETGW